MQPTLPEQTLIFLRAFAAGALLAVLYTALSCIRAVSERNGRLLFFGDLLFALLAGAVSFLYSLAVSDGQLRAYVIAAELAAFFAVYLTLGRLLVQGARRLAGYIKRLCGRLLKPITALISRIAASARRIRHNMSKKLKKSKI